jgi:CBS domain-containing protein
MTSEESCRAAGQVGNLMTPEPTTVPPETPIGEAWRMMTERRFRHMPVVKDGGSLVGIVTQSDMLVAARGTGQRIDFDNERPVSEVMNREVDTVRPETCAAEAARHMLRTKHSCLPVVNEKGSLVGILTEADYMRLSTRGAPPCSCGGVITAGS